MLDMVAIAIWISHNRMLWEVEMPDLSLLFDQHVALEFQAKDAEATMETMVDHPTVIHVPVLTGGRSTDQLRTFYRDAFIPAWPDDTEVEQVSRTVGTERAVDELIIRFTHTVEMRFWLPDIAPTGRKVEIPLVVVMGFEGDRVASEHIYWDQASLLAQIGVIDPGNLPITGAVQAHGLVDADIALNQLIESA
jgi:carboxymethylenebutenolidase